MTIYRYECNQCGQQLIADLPVERRNEPCEPHTVNSLTEPFCVGFFERVFNFSFHRSLPEHFNPSLGTYISNPASLQSTLSRQSDEMSERMGFTHQYELVDPGDPASAGVTEDGLEATERHAVDSGAKPVQFYSA